MNRLPVTRHSLLLRLTDRDDPAAWNEFLAVYEAAIYRYACSRGLQPADAEDVTQKVLAAVMDKAPSWDPNASKGRFGAWLFRVTRNLSAKVWNDRKRGAVGTGGPEAALILAEIPDPPEEEKTVFRMAYRRALFHWAADRVRGQVLGSTWRAFWMSAVEEKDAKQVAQELGLSLSSVYTAKCRLLTRIRDEIDAFEHDFEFTANED